MGERRRIEVDGEEYWWSSRTSRTKRGDCLVVTINSVDPEFPGGSLALPGITVVSEAYIVKVVRRLRGMRDPNAN